MSAKLCNFFPNFCKIFLKQCVWTIDVEKFWTIMLNIAKHICYWKKKETSAVSNSNIAQNDWKVMYVFRLARKNVLFREIYSMKNSLKQVNMDCSITNAKSKLVKIFIVLIVNLY